MLLCSVTDMFFAQIGSAERLWLHFYFEIVLLLWLAWVDRHAQFMKAEGRCPDIAGYLSIT